MKIQAIRGWRDPHVRSAPTPDAAIYDEWLNRRNRGRNAHRDPDFGINGAKLRRAVIMRKQGQTWKEIGDAVGMSASAIRAHCEFLPLDLGTG